jgi:6-phosphogluconate dehydrogenase/gluconokinase
MQNGFALNDEDRRPWLELLSNELVMWKENKGAVLACSALKESYREILMSKGVSDIQWIYLNGSKALLTERLASRKEHFFDPKLLDSQLSTLELPDYGWTVDVLSTPNEIVQELSKRLR